MVDFLRRYAPIFVAAIGIAVVAGAVLTLRGATTYRAEETLVVGQDGGFFRPGFGPSLEPFTQTIRALIESEAVATDVVGRLDLDMSPDEVLSGISTRSRSESGVVIAAYEDADEGDVVRILDAISDALLERIDSRLDEGAPPPERTSETPITVSVFDDPHLIGKVDPIATENLTMSLAVGALVGLLFSLIWELFVRRPRAADTPPLRWD